MKYTSLEGWLFKPKPPYTQTQFKPILETYCTCAVLIDDLSSSTKDEDEKFIDALNEDDVDMIYRDVYGSATLFCGVDDNYESDANKKSIIADMKRVANAVSSNATVKKLVAHAKFASFKKTGKANSDEFIKIITDYYFKDWK